MIPKNITYPLARALARSSGAIKYAERAIWEGHGINNSLYHRQIWTTASVHINDPKLTAPQVLSWLWGKGLTFTPDEGFFIAYEVLGNQKNNSPIPALRWFVEHGVDLRRIADYSQKNHSKSLTPAGLLGRISDADLGWIKAQGIPLDKLTRPQWKMDSIEVPALVEALHQVNMEKRRLKPRDVKWLEQLLDHGVKVRRGVNLEGHEVGPAPLHALAFLAKQRSLSDSQQVPYQNAWTRLVAAGDCPTLKGPDGYTPIDHLMASTMAPWLTARLRAEERQEQLEASLKRVTTRRRPRS